MSAREKTVLALGAIFLWSFAGFATEHEGVQLWENGPLWAQTNIGANSPTEAGYYFWWGDTLGYKWQNNQWVASDNSVSGFSFSAENCSTYEKTLSELQSMGYVDTNGILRPAYDPAATQWGDDWRMPKMAELENLLALCTWNWTTNSGVVGYTIKGKGSYAGNSVFIPAMGYGDGTTTNKVGTMYFWSSTADSLGTRRMTVGSGNRVWRATNTVSRVSGFPLRPVKTASSTRLSSSAALDTRTGIRVAKTTESIAYDAAWGGATSGSLKVNGTEVSGLSSNGTYAWQADTAQTNYWTLTYTAGTVNYAALFRSGSYTVKFNANGGSGEMTSIPCVYGQSATLTANSFTRAGHAFVGWMTLPDGTSIAYNDGQSIMEEFSPSSGTLNLYAKWTDTWYVDAVNGNDANLGDSWAQAFKTIQHAIDKSVTGMTVIVADGTYAPIRTSNLAITIHSVNGAEATIIDGGYPAATNRCVHAGGLVNLTNTVIRGFTIQNGCTLGLPSGNNGAGVAGGTLYNCVVKSNHCGGSGGGVIYSVMHDCVVFGNDAQSSGGGASGGRLYGCVISNNTASVNGGGIVNAKAFRCIIADNECALASTGYGGGAYNGELENCLIYGNRATTGAGGGVSRAVCRNCTIYDNSCGYNGGGAHAWIVDGVSVCTNFNCIVYGNSAGTTDNEIDYRTPSFNCCTNDPQFIRSEVGDFRLRYNSPCIDAGSNEYVTNDVDFAGNARIVGGTVDIGAYEYSAAIDTNYTVHVVNGTGGGTYYEGDTVTIAAENRLPHYVFTHWVGDDSVLADENSPTSVFTMPSRNLSFSAVYEYHDIPFPVADITVSNYSNQYDGAAHGIGVAVADGIADSVVKYATAANGEFSDTVPTLTDVGSMRVWCEIAAPGFITQTNSAAVTITKRAVTLTSGDASKVYDGIALTKHEVAVGGDGFVAGEGASYAYTGSQTDVGTSENTFTYTLNTNTKSGNYMITTDNGMLAVTKANAGGGGGEEPGSGVVPQGGVSKFDASFVYDGEGHTIDTNALESAFGSAMIGEIEVEYAKDGGLGEAALPWLVEAPTYTNAGEYVVWYKVTNPNYNDFVHAAKVTITPRPIDDAVVTLSQRMFYTGSVITQEIESVSLEGYDVTYAVYGNVATDTGDYVLTVAGTGNFTGEKAVPWRIYQPAALEAVTARPRYPWNGNVDVTFTLTGSEYVQSSVSLYAKDLAGNTNLPMRTVHKLDGSAVNVSGELVSPGTHHWVWDAAADLPDAFECDQVTVEVKAE